MNTKALSRLGAACGVIAPLALIAGRDRAFMLAVFGIVAFVPFLAYVSSLLRAGERDGGWLTQAAFGAGLMGITLKVASAAPEIAYRTVPKGSSAHAALQGIGDAATLLALYPLAIFTAIVAYQTLETGVLPRWLGAFAGLTAIALAVNGSFEHAGFVPAFLLFLLWTVVAGATLLVRGAAPQPLGRRASPAVAG
jgi:hypothetical protein